MNFIRLKNIFFIFFVCLHISFFGQNNINFKHISPHFNNKAISISDIAQDSLGIIWMNAGNGILKFNGYSYDFISKEEIFNEISFGDDIDHIHNDNLNNIWFRSEKGLISRYNSILGNFQDFSTLIKEPINVIKFSHQKIWMISKNGTVYILDDQRIEIVTTIANLNDLDNRAVSIASGNDEEVYISTSKGKVYNYSMKTKVLNEIVGPFSGYPTSIVLQLDNDNKLWIGTEAFGLFIYDIRKKEFVQNIFLKDDAYDLKKELFLNLFLDSNDNIWGGTDGGGLYKINSLNGEVSLYKKDHYNEFSLSSNTIIDVNEDNHKNIWIVTNYGAINIIPKPNKHVKYHKGSANNVPLRILTAYKDQNNNLWIGTDGNGLTLVKDDSNYTKQFFANSNFYVQSISEDNYNNIWFGTYKNGLWYYDQKLKVFEGIPVFNAKNQQATDIRTVFKDSKGRIWIGSNIAINIYDSDKNLLASFGYDLNGLNGTILESIIEDNEQNIWLGISSGGLFKFNENSIDLNNSSFTNFKNNLEKKDISVRSMSFGKSDEIWIINGKRKLLIFNTKSKEYKQLDEQNILNEQAFNSVIAEDSSNIWMSSTNGIYHFNRTKNLVRAFYTTDGFQCNSYMLRSAYKDKEGLLYFGTQEGLNFFEPKKITKEKSNAKLFISDIQVLNKPAKSLLKDQINSDIFSLEKLDLKNNQSSFSIKFSAIDNILNPNYYYSYKLNGVDKDWKTIFSEGLITYTNVPPGKYTLEIRANEMNETSFISNRDLIITISQPFWKKPLAYFLYFILFSFLLFWGIRWYFLRKKLLINKISRRKEKELHEAKMNFFAKMSHEIQTPITLILSPIEDMLKSAEHNGNMLLKERLKIISNNANRLSRIARELTLTRNKELNRLILSVTHNDLHRDVTKVCLSFKELARSKKIDFLVNCPKNLSNAWYDKEKLEHILYNLLSNAFKFTPLEGNVQLTIIPINKKKFIRIAVSDSGRGINEEELKNIFKIFYRSKKNKGIEGTGIGLALTKELVNLHKGKIKVKSIPEEGTTFFVKLPIAEENYKDSEKITSGEKNELLHTKEENTVLKQNYDYSKKTILVVEDNFELQLFLKNLLHEQYNILLAENGQEGFYLAKNNLPELIISDVMMPEMDGVEMCKELNKHNLTKHIPVILLTAKNSTKAKIEGLKTGAIEYINKPFNTNELLLKINNIFISKEHIITKYRKELINKPEIKINKSQDEIFLEKLTFNVNNRLNDPKFKVDELANILNISYSSLYRKCLSVTGLNLIDFVKLLRLKKAAIILAKYGYTISEVAYLVGFNDPKYFSKSFKKHFKITPKDFKTQAFHSDDIENFLASYNLKSVDFMDEIES